jgi:hypothetical protein
MRSIAACFSPTSAETPRVPLALPVNLPKNSPTVGELSPGKVVPHSPISGSAPETSFTTAPEMLITTASFIVVVFPVGTERAPLRILGLRPGLLLRLLLPNSPLAYLLSILHARSAKTLREGFFCVKLNAPAA